MDSNKSFSRIFYESNNRKLDEFRERVVFGDDFPRTELNRMLDGLFVLDYEDSDLMETVHTISSVVDIVDELYDGKSDAEALTVLIVLLKVLSEHYERDSWYSMYDDYNEMDYSPVKKRVEVLLRSLFKSHSIEEGTLCSLHNEFEVLAEENVLGNYTSWNLRGWLEYFGKN